MSYILQVIKVLKLPGTLAVSYKPSIQKVMEWSQLGPIQTKVGSHWETQEEAELCNSETRNKIKKRG